MHSSTDPRVDAYIDSLPEWQQVICREVRSLADHREQSGRRLAQAKTAGR